MDRPQDPSIGSHAPFVQLVRWLAFIPAAVAAGILANVVVVLLNRLTMAHYVDPSSFMGRVFLEYIGGAVLGAAAVYVGAYVAPRRKPIAAWTLAALVIAASGFVLFPAVLTADYRAVFSLLCTAGGAAVIAYLIATGEVKAGNDYRACDRWSLFSAPQGLVTKR